jgi:mRNA interferase MazF
MVKDWQGAGLLKPSVIKPVITTIESGLILNNLGQLKEDDRAALERSIGQILG